MVRAAASTSLNVGSVTSALAGLTSTATRVAGTPEFPPWPLAESTAIEGSTEVRLHFATMLHDSHGRDDECSETLLQPRQQSQTPTFTSEHSAKSSRAIANAARKQTR